jgi:hypothetical protein
MSTAVLLTSNQIRAKHIARILFCAGVRPTVTTSLEQAQAAIQDGVTLACFDAEALDSLVPMLRQQPQTQALVWSGEKNAHTVAAAPSVRQLNNVFGLRYPSAPPRNWELLRVVRQLTESDTEQPGGMIHLDWGASLHERSPASSAELDDVVSEVEQFAAEVCNPRLSASLASVAHELLMNAMYDAPVDPGGNPLFTFRRNEAIELNDDQRPELCYGCDGSRFVISVSDPFGGLRREHVFGGIARALAKAMPNRTGGGAGLGLAVVFRAMTILFFNVRRGYRTEATAVLELDVPQRELRTLPRSVHFFSKEPS